MMTIEEIYKQYPEEIAAVKGGDDLMNYDDLYYDLFEHYCHTGEMPYGTAKARDGDPCFWIMDRLGDAQPATMSDPEPVGNYLRMMPPIKMMY